MYILPSTGPKNKELAVGVVKFVPVIAYHLCLNLPFSTQYKIVPLQLVLRTSSPTFCFFDKSGKKILFPPASHYRSVGSARKSLLSLPPHYSVAMIGEVELRYQMA